MQDLHQPRYLLLACGSALSVAAATDTLATFVLLTRHIVQPFLRIEARAMCRGDVLSDCS